MRKTSTSSLLRIVLRASRDQGAYRIMSAPEGSSSVANAGGSSSSSTMSTTAAPAGAFGKRFPRLTATFQKYSSSRAGRIATTAWTRKRPIFVGLAISYGVISYAVLYRDSYLRDQIHQDTWLTLKVHPGSIVDCRSGPNITALLNSPSAGEDRPSVMELFEVCRAIKWASKDVRIRGIFADFSGLHIPSSVSPNPLGMAQIEELVEAIHEFNMSKKEQYYLKQATGEQGLESVNEIKDKEAPTQADVEAITKELTEKLEKAAKEAPPPPIASIAWADSFDSQGSYLLASAFDQVYIQPSGEVPLTGVAMQIPFIKKALDWLGVKVHAEARKEFKSMIATFTQDEGLTPSQLEDEAKLLGELSRTLTHAVGVNRFPHLEAEKAADHVTELTKRGPFSANDALKEGLVTGIKYKSEVIKELGEEPEVKTLASYSRITDRALSGSLSEDLRPKVAVVFLQGTISNAPGDFSASSVIKGLKEAGEDEDVHAIVLRIDSGGGDVVASDSIWDAVRRVQIDNNKPVIASFGNASASGGYYASAGADAIVACESTITGSIGVAALRPTLTKKLFDRVGIQLQTIFTGSKTQSSLHSLEPDEKARMSKHIDETYDTFLDKVCTGRKISPDVIGELAGGRVWTGLAAWLRCNPVFNSSDDSAAEGKESANLPSGKEETTPGPPRVVEIPNAHNLINIRNAEWKTTDVTQDEEMSTIRINSVPLDASSISSLASAGAEDPEEILRKEILAEFADHKSDDQSQKRRIVAHSIVEEDRLSEADEGELAAIAHEIAESSHEPKEIVRPAQAEIKLGPYGKGLIDSIGGIYDATCLALVMGYERQVNALVKEGKTLEQAAKEVLPAGDYEVGPDGSVVTGGDLRLIRYPKEKSWRERLRDVSKSGDKPSLSLLPGIGLGFGNIGLQVRELLSDVAVQVLVKCWRDPTMVQRMISEVEREKSIKMEYSSHMRM